ncbi:MAG: hypothetical protein ACI87W_000608 [Halieaceae bacterium]|jgi:hypothetical protein
MAAFSAAMSERDPEFSIHRKISHNPDRPTAKSYFFECYGVASTTLEMGDGTLASTTHDYAGVADEAFTRAWLQQP